MKLIQYAVRVKGTHKYLPRPQRRDGRGGSHLEPVDFSDRSTWPKRYSKDMMIRTYTTEKAAKNMLTSWLSGKYYYDEGLPYNKPTPERRIEDMEIVQITLVLPD